MKINLDSTNGHIIIALVLLAFAVAGHYVGFPGADAYILALWTFLFSKLDPKTTATFLGGPPSSITIPTASAMAGSGDTVHVETKEVPLPVKESVKGPVKDPVKENDSSQPQVLAQR